MTIYIAGPMTGMPDYNREAFAVAEALLKAAGHIAINPGKLPTGLPDEKYLPICTAMIDAAEAIYMLDGWQRSVGARAERLYAKRQGKIELFEKDVKVRTAAMEREENV